MSKASHLLNAQAFILSKDWGGIAATNLLLISTCWLFSILARTDCESEMDVHVGFYFMCFSSHAPQQEKRERNKLYRFSRLSSIKKKTPSFRRPIIFGWITSRTDLAKMSLNSNQFTKASRTAQTESLELKSMKIRFSVSQDESWECSFSSGFAKSFADRFKADR